MGSKVRTQPGTRKPVHAGHGKGHCLKILERLSAYIDDELSNEVCREIRSHLGHCPNCEVFLDSLRQTVRLCQNRPVPTLSAQARSTLRRQILKTAASS